MEPETRSLIYLTAGCALAAALTGFVTGTLSFRGSYANNAALVGLLQVTRLAVFLILALVLVFRGGWWGVVATAAMVVAATTIEWALFPLSLSLASIPDPAGYAERFGSLERPSYAATAAFDVIGISLCAGFAQALRTIARATPGRRDE
jgi:hypothetical protein